MPIAATAPSWPLRSMRGSLSQTPQTRRSGSLARAGDASQDSCPLVQRRLSAMMGRGSGRENDRRRSGDRTGCANALRTAVVGYLLRRTGGLEVVIPTVATALQPARCYRLVRCCRLSKRRRRWPGLWRRRAHRRPGRSGSRADARCADERTSEPGAQRVTARLVPSVSSPTFAALFTGTAETRDQPTQKS